ncbi:uncharacterized protein [Symphalangus syndactylus]|uniref:uncharacterized protein n=1 Tax=Symphalangus syndactylus TaxID=9590 RepID=UPI00300772B6
MKENPTYYASQAKRSVLQSQSLIAGVRIPQGVTSDRNYRVSPGTNHSSKDSSSWPAGSGTPSPDSPRAGWRPPNPHWSRVSPRRTCCASPPSASRSQAQAPAAMHLPWTTARRPQPPPRPPPAWPAPPPPEGLPAARGPAPALPTPPPRDPDLFLIISATEQETKKPQHLKDYFLWDFWCLRLRMKKALCVQNLYTF